MEVCESMPLKDGLELEKKLPKEAMVDCHESVTSEACHKSVTSEDCHKSVTSEDCHKSVTSEDCHKSVTSDDCHKSVTSDDCHKSVTSDDCHKSVTSDDCHKSVTSEDCHKSVTSEDCHKSVTSEDCHKSVTSDDCHKSVTSDDCHKSLRSEDHSKTPEKEDYHKNVANEDHKRTHDTEDSLDTSAGNEDHQKGRLHGDAVDPYKLNWPGLLSLPVYIIDPNTKTVYEPSNPLPPSQAGLNSVEHKYVMVQSVIDLFTADCRLRALDTLIHLSSLYDLHKFHTIAKVGYMHIGTLLAFLVVYPWCNSFQKVRGSVLQFLIRYIEGQCWLCGFIRRDCRCGTSTYDAEVVQVDHRVEYADKGIQVEPPNTVGNPLTAVLLPGGTQMQPGMRVPMSSFRFSSENPMHMGPSFPAGAQTNGMPRTGMYQVPIPQMNYVPVSANPVTGTDSAAGKSQASPVNTANRFMQQSPGWGGPLTPNTAACMWTMGNGAPYGFTPVMPTTQHSNPGFLSPPQQMMSSRFMPPPFQTPPATAGVTTSTDSANHMTSIVKPGTHVVMPGTTAAGMVPIGMPAPCQLMKPLPAKKFVKNMSTQTRPVAREKRCKGTNYMMSTVKRKSLDDNDKTAGNESEAKKVKGSDTGDVAEGEKTPIRTFTEMQLWRLIEDDEEEDVKNKEKSSSVVSVTSALAGPVENADEETAEAICRRVVTDIVGRVLGETDEAKEARTGHKLEDTDTASTIEGNSDNQTLLNEDKSKESVEKYPIKSDETSDQDRTDGDKETNIDLCSAETQKDLAMEVTGSAVVTTENQGDTTGSSGIGHIVESVTSGTQEDHLGARVGEGMTHEVKQETAQIDSDNAQSGRADTEMEASGDATSTEKGLGEKSLKNIESLCERIGGGGGGDPSPGVTALDAAPASDFKRLDSVASSDGKVDVSEKVDDGSSEKTHQLDETNDTRVSNTNSHEKDSEDPKKKSSVQTAESLKSHASITEMNDSPQTSSKPVGNVSPSLAVATCNNKRKTCYGRFEYIPTGEKMYRCMYQTGGQCFDNRKAADMHDQAHRVEGQSTKTSLFCHLCDYSVTSTHWYDLIRHLKSQHFVMLTTKQFGCTLCGIVFENEEELSSHLEFHYNSRYKCIYCGVLLMTWKHVQQHVANECTDVKKTTDATYFLGCPYCPLVFHKKTIKKIHTLSHTDAGLICIFCRDDSPWDVWRHLRKHYQQRHAKKLLGNISLLNPPEKYRRPKCHMCQLEFRLQDDFKLHMVKTHDLVPYVSVECDLCQKVYRNEKVRDRHVKKVHVEELKCNKCTYIAKTPLLLKVHQKAEHVERPHMCSECDRTFVSYRELKVHMVRHATRSIHLCKTCGIELKSFAELKRHKLKEHPTVASMSSTSVGRDAIICPECNYRCYSRIALGKHLKKLHPDQELAPDDPDHSYFSSTASPPPVAKRQKVAPVVRAIVKKKLPYVKSLPMKLPKGKKKKKLPKGKERKGHLVEKGVKLRRLKRYGCARLRTIADYHREQRQREAEELMNVTIPAGTGAMAARLSSSSKHNREVVSMVDLDHCYARVDEPSVYTTRVRIENDSKLKMTVFAAAASVGSVVTSNDKMDAAASSDTISARSTPSPDGATLSMQDPILEGASKLVSMLRQQMESGEIGSDLANLLPVSTGTMAADIHDEGIVGLDLMDDGRNIEQQLTDILDSMQQETSPGGASGQHSKTNADASMAFSSNPSTNDMNLESDIQLEACDVVAEHTTLDAEGAREGEGYGMDVDEIELGEADYQLWQENHNSGANIEVQDVPLNLPDTTSCDGLVPPADQETDSGDNSGDNSGDDAANDSCGDEGINSVPSEKQQQQPCLVDHQYY